MQFDTGKIRCIENCHLDRYDFDFFTDKVIYTVGSECVTKVFDLVNGEIIKSKDLPDQMYTMEFKPTDRQIFAMGGDSKRALLVKNYEISLGYPAVDTTGRIFKTVWSPKGQMLAVASQESSISIFISDNQRIYQCQNPEHQGFGQNCAFSSDSQFIITTGCDGFGIIYDIGRIMDEDNPAPPQKVGYFRIGKEFSHNSSMIAQPMWHPSESWVALPGSEILAIAAHDKNWKYTPIIEICHHQEISIVYWCNDDILVTICVENFIKIWNFPERRLVSSQQLDSPVSNIRYNANSNQLIYCHFNGALSIWDDILPKNQISNLVNSARRSMSLNGERMESINQREENEESSINSESAKQNKFLESNFGSRAEDSQMQIIGDQRQLQTSTPTKEIQQMVIGFDENKLFQKESNTGQMEEFPVDLKLKEKGGSNIINSSSQVADGYEQKQKQKVMKSQADLIIDYSPQDILYSSSTKDFFRNRQFLCWNYVGSVALRQQTDGTSMIDIEFADKQFHQNFKEMDKGQNISMAMMNYKGVLLASQAEIHINEDEYEKEAEEDDEGINLDENDENFDKNLQTQSRILFRSFSNTDGNWDLILDESENVETVAIGNDWCAVSTDLHYIRVFSQNGMEMNVFSFEKPIVCMAGYENLLAYVYHDSAPILGCQSLRMKIINIETDEIYLQIGVPHTPYNKLEWFGFSEEGLLLTYDTAGMMRALFNDQNWVPIFDNKLGFETKFWFLGMSNYEIIGIELEKDEIEPSVFPRPLPKTYPLKMALVAGPNCNWWSQDSQYENILKQKHILDHEKQRYRLWNKYKASRDTDKDALCRYSDDIYSLDKIDEKETQIEYFVLKLYKECINQQEHERALLVVKNLLKSVESYEICVEIGEQKANAKFNKKLQALVQEKKRQKLFENDNGSQNNVTNKYQDHKPEIKDSSLSMPRPIINHKSEEYASNSQYNHSNQYNNHAYQDSNRLPKSIEYGSDQYVNKENDKSSQNKFPIQATAVGQKQEERKIEKPTQNPFIKNGNLNKQSDSLFDSVGNNQNLKRKEPDMGLQQNQNGIKKFK